MIEQPSNARFGLDLTVEPVRIACRESMLSCTCLSSNATACANHGFACTSLLLFLLLVSLFPPLSFTVCHLCRSLINPCILLLRFVLLSISFDRNLPWDCMIIRKHRSVFVGAHRQTGAIVALKRINTEQEENGFPITALREVKILKALNHVNIVNLIEIVTSRGKKAKASGALLRRRPAFSGVVSLSFYWSCRCALFATFVATLMDKSSSAVSVAAATDGCFLRLSATLSFARVPKTFFNGT